MIAEAFQKTVSVASALLSGTDVSSERMRKRLEICSGCEKAQDIQGTMRCGICSCKLADRGLFNLARYEETDMYGCKHEDGSKWKKAGV